ncbi:MAG: glutaredoxin 3 [Neisseria sp.]|uniref:glutaredoxin 3 n=1 Tax=Neisseria sp. TaxID=192066 RepID=UPI0026DAF79F|nr:glutaredoxin 3 [Neisseria sp.]MDO4640632.1 glutaredoxin 3 [Neisseria sp.]
MQQVTMYTGSFCPYCNMAKQMLRQLGVEEIKEINADREPQAFAQMQRTTGQRSVPQIFIGETHIGGFTDMYSLHQRGGLVPLLNQE